jgi:hypothetical protein
MKCIYNYRSRSNSKSPKRKQKQITLPKKSLYIKDPLFPDYEFESGNNNETKKMITSETGLSQNIVDFIIGKYMSVRPSCLVVIFDTKIKNFLAISINDINLINKSQNEKYKLQKYPCLKNVSMKTIYGSLITTSTKFEKKVIHVFGSNMYGVLKQVILNISDAKHECWKIIDKRSVNIPSNTKNIFMVPTNFVLALAILAHNKITTYDNSMNMGKENMYIKLYSYYSSSLTIIVLDDDDNDLKESCDRDLTNDMQIPLPDQREDSEKLLHFYYPNSFDKNDNDNTQDYGLYCFTFQKTRIICYKLFLTTAKTTENCLYWQQCSSPSNFYYQKNFKCYDDNHKNLTLYNGRYMLFYGGIESTDSWKNRTRCELFDFKTHSWIKAPFNLPISLHYAIGVYDINGNKYTKNNVSISITTDDILMCIVNYNKLYCLDIRTYKFNSENIKKQNNWYNWHLMEKFENEIKFAITL